MRIAPARMEDLPQVLAIERQVPEAPHWSEGEYKAIIEATKDDETSIQRCLLVVSLTEDIIGYAVGKVVADEAELESVAIQGCSRRQGAACTLCNAVIRWAWTSGAQWMDLEVRAGSIGANALYDRLGFIEVGRRPRYYSDPVDDAVLRRLLRPAQG